MLCNLVLFVFKLLYKDPFGNKLLAWRVILSIIVFEIFCTFKRFINYLKFNVYVLMLYAVWYAE